jgi:hypothetical protein
MRLRRRCRVEISVDAKPSTVEEQINAWLDNLSSATIIKSETVITAIAGKPTDGTFSASS